MWHGPVTSCAWFNNYENSKQGMGKTSSSSVLPVLPVASAHMGKPIYTEKPERHASSRSRRDRDYTTTRSPTSRNPYPTPPPKNDEPSRYPSQRSQRQPGSGNSPRYGASTVPDLESGGMLNPYSRTRGSR